MESRWRIMAMKDVVMKDLIQAMRDKDARKKGVLQLVKAGLDNAEKVKKSALDEKEEVQIVQREIKQTKDFLVEAVKLDRKDSIEDANLKLEILYAYLPKQLTEDQVIAELTKLGIEKGMNMGEAMKIAVPALSGKTENALISKSVKSLIS